METIKAGDRCNLCGGTMAVRKATVEKPYRYEMSGLDNVFLAGIEVQYCSRCNVQMPVIPKIDGLHKQIAKYLVFKKGLLSGKEIRFLRKNAGIPANQFAALLEIEPEHLSRVENGKIDNFSAATDKLARAVAMAANDGEDVRKILMALADSRIRDKNPVFGLKKDHWEKLAA